MFLVALLRHGLRLLLPLAIASTFYLYLYPVFLGCAFPLPLTATTNTTTRGLETPSESAAGLPAFLETLQQHVPKLPIPSRTDAQPAPFRLLALGDPQLEGDSSIPNSKGPRVPHLQSLYRHVTYKTAHSSLRERIRQALHDWIDFIFEDVFVELESLRKHIDLFGNDFYLAHIYRTVHWWTKPTHLTVLGDLLGSQWVKDDEFQRRAGRFWNRVFRGTERVPDETAVYPAMDYDLSAIMGNEGEEAVWQRRAINIVGNHDIGYAGDINEDRLRRFEKAFGKANYELRFELGRQDPTANGTLYDEATNPTSDRLPPELRVVVLNDMNLDTPARDAKLQDDTYKFINDVIATSSAVEFRGHFTIVLTHVPLYKPEGVCVDAPLFTFHDHDGGLKEQNQLSSAVSKGFLEGIYGMSGDPHAPGHGLGRPGVILNGHDHEGCDTYHFIRQVKEGNRYWDVSRWEHAKGNGTVGADGLSGIREITVRSMMGDFGGNAGLLSAWFDEATWSWKFEYATCALGTQHLWWAVHILDLITVVVAVAYAVVSITGLASEKGTAKTPQRNGSAVPATNAKKQPKDGKAANGDAAQVPKNATPRSPEEEKPKKAP
ncbi:hypothetical protein VDGD_06219 [Verticillium dahliae]|nr:hypothetical protein VDGD_06219 [Verticillium dahliae]